MSDFPDMVTQFGGVPVGGGMLPIMSADAKAFFVDPVHGKTTNDGKSPKRALTTVQAAFDKTTSGHGDVVYLLNDGSTTGTARDVAITWDHNNTHLVGLCAPGLNRRARIAPASTATSVDLYSPYITLSGSGCVFQNFSLSQGISEDSHSSIGITVSGSRNFIQNVDVITGADADQGDEACESVRVTGSENVFDSCYIGGDTWLRGGNAISANVRIGAGTGSQASRNVFKNCLFTMFADDTEPLFIRSSFVTDIDRWILFDNCTFINSGTSTIAEAVGIAGSSTGRIFLKNCAFYGCTDVTAADSTYVQVWGPTPGTPVDSGLFKSVDIS
jgi:hypothetical protein